MWMSDSATEHVQGLAQGSRLPSDLGLVDRVGWPEGGLVLDCHKEKPATGRHARREHRHIPLAILRFDSHTRAAIERRVKPLLEAIPAS